MGSELDFQAAMRGSLRSTTVTLMCGFCFAMMAQVGPPYDAGSQQEVIFSGGRGARTTYHVAGADAADVGDVAGDLPVGHCAGRLGNECGCEDAASTAVVSRRPRFGAEEARGRGATDEGYVWRLAWVGAMGAGFTPRARARHAAGTGPGRSFAKALGGRQGGRQLSARIALCPVAGR